MGAEIFYKNEYIIMLFAGIITYIGTFLVYLKKAKTDFNKFENKLYYDTSKKYSKKKYLPYNTIEIIFDVDKIKSKYRFIRNSFKLNLWGAIIFLASCFLGFGLTIAGKEDSLALLGIFAGGLYFIITLVIILIWHYNVND